jgi:hypothetical protein
LVASPPAPCAAFAAEAGPTAEAILDLFIEGIARR